ncbi:MAG: hypothetical protein ACRC2U_18665 [Aeromonas sp.]
MARLKAQLRRDAAVLAALGALMGDSRRRLLVCLLMGDGVVKAARLAGLGDETARDLAKRLADEGFIRRGSHGRIGLSASGKRAALAALQPLKSAVMAGASQVNDDLF